ncbi:hypothetical protein AAG906_030104 [Vitis piasezkii]
MLISRRRNQYRLGAAVAWQDVWLAFAAAVPLKFVFDTICSGWWRSQEDTWNQRLPMEYDANSLVCLMNKKLMTLLSFIEIML